MAHEQQHPHTLILTVCKLSDDKELSPTERDSFDFAFPKLTQLANMSIPGRCLQELSALKREGPAAWQDFIGKYQLDSNHYGATTRRTPGQVIRLGRFKGVAIAAFIIIALGVMLFPYIKMSLVPVRDLSATTPKKGDIAPGTTGGTLILAHNQTIQLDSAKKGVIATQGTIAIEKTDSGQINYVTLKKDPINVVYKNILFTPSGRTFTVQLLDGSRIYLNAQSSIRYPSSFEGTSREVFLQEGEAYFEITKGKPFTVQLDQFRIDVLGTGFNVSTYQKEGRIKATLEHGAIKITKGEEEYMLQPGQQAELVRSTGQINIIDHANVEEVVAWKSGFFSWKSKDLKSIMRQIERWYSVTVTYAQEPLPKLYNLSKISRNTPLTKLLNLLKESGDFDYDINDQTVTIKR